MDDAELEDLRRSVEEGVARRRAEMATWFEPEPVMGFWRWLWWGLTGR